MIIITSRAKQAARRLRGAYVEDGGFIGYSVAFYDDDERGLLHAICLEDELEQAKEKNNA